MRAAIFVASAVVLGLSGVAAAQTWTSYANREYRVAIDFPGQPVEKDIAYKTKSGATVPARQFSVERGTNRYLLTVAVFPSGPGADEQEVEHAAALLRARGAVRVAAADAYDPGVPGRQLSIVEKGGRELLAVIYMYDHRLYIAEGSVAAGASAPVQFQQSMTILDAKGEQLDLDDGGGRGGQ